MRTMKHVRLAQAMAKAKARAVVDGPARNRTTVFSSRIQEPRDLECEANAMRGPVEPNHVNINR